MKTGIDYSLGQSNVDKKTGIHYGVISQHSVIPEALDNVEYDYGDPHCPKCGDAVTESDVDQDNEYYCEKCATSFDSDDVWNFNEPSGWSYNNDGYQLTDCLDTDIFVLSSPYFTYAQYCSPCVPGAGNLDTYCVDGVKTYALGHDWFESGKAPYPLFNVEDNSEVLP